MASPLLGIAGVNSLLFAAYGASKRIISPFPQLSLKEIAAAGAMAGAANAILASPGTILLIGPLVFLNLYSPSWNVQGSYAGSIWWQRWQKVESRCKWNVEKLGLPKRDHERLLGMSPFHGNPYLGYLCNVEMQITFVREIPAYAGYVIRNLFVQGPRRSPPQC